MVKVVIGTQYGDEGKGRVSHYLSAKTSMVIRATGGNNAGHTVVANGKKYAVHLLPSSIIRDVKSLIGPGVVIDLNVLNHEIKEMESEGFDLSNRLFISDKAHVILPHYIELDKLYETFKKDPVGTTGRGIGPAYEHKCRRVGIRMIDLFLSDEELRDKIIENMKVYDILVKDGISVDDVLEYCKTNFDNLKKYICNTQAMIKEAFDNNEDIVIEGAQALGLDLDHGDYPMVTSSNPNASGSASGSGVGPTLVDEVIGVMKAYSSRVGEGPYVTEQDNEIGDLIRELGHEYGTTTGRPRRCGWLDLVLINHSKYINGLTSLCINHVDTIGKLDKIKICVGYKKDDKVFDYVPTDLNGYEAIYEEFDGSWDTNGCKTFDDLPDNAKKYLLFIEKFTGIKIKYIGIGADESATIIR